MIELVPMSASTFDEYLAQAIQEYAAEHARSGTWSAEQALVESKRQFQELLPDGVTSKDQYLYSVRDMNSGTNVGMLWFAVRTNGSRNFAFIYDINIYEPFQRKGFAAQALDALDARVKEMNLHEIELHVFGHNTAARALYEKAGYVAKNIRMVKQVD